MNPLKLRQIVCAPASDSSMGGGGESSGTIAQAKQAITSTARDTAARIKSAAGDTAERAKTEAQRYAAEAKDETAQKLGGYSSAMHDSAKAFEEQDPNIAWATHRVADRIQGVADYFRNQDFAGLRNDAENLARRHPLAFFGGLFVAGLVVGNLLKARQPSDETDENTNWDTGNQSGTETFSQSMADTPATSTSGL